MGEEGLHSKRKKNWGGGGRQKRENIKLFCNNGTYPQQDT